MAAVHIVNPLWNANGGSEWHSVSLFELLAETEEVYLWTSDTPDPAYLGRYPIRRIGPNGMPQGGNIVFLGVYGQVGGWIRAARPRRVIIVYNVFQPERLQEFITALHGVPGLPQLEVSFVSDYLRRSTPDVPGTVHISPIDLSLFSPGPTVDRPFTIGRVSRDIEYKHHPEELDLYKELASQGAKVRILGGTCLTASDSERSALAEQGIELLPVGAEPVNEYLRTIDTFYYRTHPIYQEAWGRVVLEAMASGLPVVAGRQGGYADAVMEGENGYIVDSTGEARARLKELMSNHDLRRQMGAAALETANTVYSRSAMRELAGFYAG